jgi:hypothetical protein
MWMTSRHLSLHPAVLIALFGQIRDPQPASLTQLDRHMLRDIGVDPSQIRAPSPSPPLTTPRPESASPQRSAGRTPRPTNG